MPTKVILYGEEYNKKKLTLNKVKSDSTGWLTYYTDADSKKWIEEYPHSEYHGGGPPQLRQLDAFPWEQFGTRQFRFKVEYFQINGIGNIPGLIICSGHGYDLRTYCCKNCGELFVADFQSFDGASNDLKTIIAEKFCPNCGDSLQLTLVSYPDNIFYEGTLLKNNNTIDKVNFERTELKEVWTIN